VNRRGQTPLLKELGGAFINVSRRPLDDERLLSLAWLIDPLAAKFRR